MKRSDLKTGMVCHTNHGPYQVMLNHAVNGITMDVLVAVGDTAPGFNQLTVVDEELVYRGMVEAGGDLFTINKVEECPPGHPLHKASKVLWTRDDNKREALL